MIVVYNNCMKQVKSACADNQAERLYRAFSELVRSYQFRDRDEIGCHGISLSQCHALDHLYSHGPLAMGELGGLLYLDDSTMTRLVDGLVLRKLVQRVPDPDDRRVRRVRLTAGGRALTRSIRSRLVDEYAGVLDGISRNSREAVVTAVERLLMAFRARQAGEESRSA